MVVGSTLDIAAQPAGAGVGGLEGTIHPWLKRDLPDNGDWMLQTNFELYGLQFGDFITGLMVEVEREGKRFRYGLGNQSGNQLSVIQVTPAATTGSLFSSDYTLTSDMDVRLQRQGNDLVFEWRVEDNFEEVFRLNLPDGTKFISGGPFAATESPLELNVVFDYVLLSSPSSISTHSGDLVVTELMYKPEGGEEFEFIELFNAGDSSISLKDFRFSQGEPFDEFVFDDVSLDAGAYIMLVNDIDAFRSRYGSGLDSLIAGEWGGGSLSNGGELVTLTDELGLVVFSFEYDDSEPWPVSPDENGTSLTLSDPFSGGLSNSLSWTVSSTVGGSPGGIETTSPFLSWLQGRGQIDPLAIKEGEVTSNLLTYAFGFDLTNEYGGIKPNLVNIEGQDYISFTFSRRTSDDALDYQIQLSLDGVNWSNGINEILKVEEIDLIDNVKSITYRMKNPVDSGSKTFFRVFVDYK